jgi:hypothetical protein
MISTFSVPYIIDSKFVSIVDFEFCITFPKVRRCVVVQDKYELKTT